MRIYKYEWTAKRVFVAENSTSDMANNPLETAQIIRDLGICEKMVEQVFTIYLNVKGKIIGYDVASVGSINQSCCDPRNVFRGAILKGAAAIIMAHNHPSEDASPSQADIQTAEQIKKCGGILGIKLLDSMIITNNGYFSFYENNML